MEQPPHPPCPARAHGEPAVLNGSRPRWTEAGEQLDCPLRMTRDGTAGTLGTFQTRPRGKYIKYKEIHIDLGVVSRDICRMEATSGQSGYNPSRELGHTHHGMFHVTSTK